MNWELGECEYSNDPPHEHWELYTPLFSAFLSQRCACPEVIDFEDDHAEEPWAAGVFYQGAEDGQGEIEAPSKEECLRAVEELFRSLLSETMKAVDSRSAASTVVSKPSDGVETGK